MNRLRSYIPALFIFIVIAFFIWALAPKEDFSKRITEKINDQKDLADITFKDATLAEIYDGVKYWELIAKDSSINNSKGIANMLLVDGLFFDKGRPTIKFIAPKALWLINKNEISLTDPIGYDIKSEKLLKAVIEEARKNSHNISNFHLPEPKARDYDGYWFQSSNLNWKLATKKLICTGSISLTKGNAIISSDKLEADVGLEKVELTGRPTAEIKANGNKIAITANRFYVDSVTDKIIAEGKVAITRSASRITAGRTIYDQINDIVDLYDDVYLTDGNITAYSKSASYDIKENKMTMKDKAKAKRGGNEVYGDMMTILLGQNKIIVEGRTKVKINETDIK